ncbi:Calreticulin-domain-containing protein [Colletotrichum somersetense]|nr:Calreticulin-domain-containing protein [Colletotrichum somersetense]
MEQLTPKEKAALAGYIVNVALKSPTENLTSPPPARIVKTIELYTLIVHPNNTFIIQKNGEQVNTGSLLEDFSPAVNPKKEINDPKASKPKE